MEQNNKIIGKTKYFAGNILLFTIATFLPKALVFIMVPLYTHCLTTVEYGTADLLTNTVSLLMPVLTLQVQDAMIRYALQNEYDKSDILSIGIKITTIGGITLISICSILNLTGILKIESIYLIFLCINYFAGSLNNIFSYFCRGIDQVKAITTGSIINTVLSISCNLLFLLVFKWGLVGYLWANTIGAITRVIYIFLKADLSRFITFTIKSSKVQKDILAFSIPMVFSALSWWVNNASDKYILTYISGMSVVGIYAVSSKIPSILSAFGEVISKSFSISAIREFDSNDTDGFLGSTYSMISFCMTFICSFIMLFNLLLAKILFANDFFVAWKYCPLLLLSVLFNQLSLSCENILLGVANTKVISWTAILGALINTGLNILLIPYLEVYGAAIATAIGFCTVWGIRYVSLNKYIKLKHSIIKELVSYGLLIIQTVLAIWGNTYIVTQIIISVILLFVYKKQAVELISIIKKIKNSFLNVFW